jgi:hypothetical protein
VRPIPIALLVAAAALPAAFTLDPAFDHDTWWHLRVGQLVAETGSVPTFDPFSRLGCEQPTPWIAYSWLYEWGLYQAYAALGPVGVLWVRTLLGAFSTATVFALILGRTGLTGRGLLSVGFAAITLMPMMKERPWHLTIAFTALTVAVVGELRNGASPRRFAWLPILFALWANVHIQFVLGWLVLGLACLTPGAAKRQSLILLTAGCVVATFLNPYHVRLLGVVWQYATQTGPLRSVQELAPPEAASPWLWAGLALLGWAAARVLHRKPTDVFALLLLAVALVLVLRMRRDVWLAAVAFGGAWRSEMMSRVSKASIIGIVFATFIGVRLLNLAGFGPAADTTTANAQLYPVRAAAYVREHAPPGPLFNSFNWGGYLIWALPEYPVSIDGRTNLYGSERIARSIRTWDGEPGWDADPELRSARLVIAPRARPLTRLLRERPNEWRVAYEDETAVVFVASR